MPDFVDLEIHGSTEEATGFVEGFRLASGVEDVFFAHRENVKSEGILDAIASTMKRTTHIIVSAEFAVDLVRALEASTVLGLEADAPEPLDHAEMEFAFKCFTPEDARGIRDLVEKQLPVGVVLEGFECSEKHDPGSKGAELYSPSHDYECEGRGLYHGPVPGIIALSRRLTDQPFVHPSTVELVRRD
jgi:hypothetical protein